MKKFLEQIAEEILLNYDNHNTNLIIILQNKRSEIFLKNYLKEKTNDTYWFPDFYTTDEFIIKQSRLNLLDPILIYFELFEIHKSLQGENAMPFEDFLNWAPVMLSDFNDIDLYQADAKQVFKHLTEAKAIELWNLSTKPLTALQSDYIAFYQSLFTYYSRLKSRLISKNFGYKGMIYQHLSKNIEELTSGLSAKEFILIGFNALSASEKEIFNHINTNFKTTFYWDTDEYYMFPEKMGLYQLRAGRFINDLIDDWKLKDIKWIGHGLSQGKKEIHIHGIAKQIGQVKFVGQQLFNWEVKTSGIDTAIVLADENLLLPLLHSLPYKTKGEEEIDIHYNITMGYPLYNSSLSRFILQWLSFIIRSKDTSTGGFDTMQFTNLLKNPIVSALFEREETNTLNTVIDALTNSNQVYFQAEEIKNNTHTYKFLFLEQLFSVMLIEGEDALSFIHSLIQFLQLLANKVKKEEKYTNSILEAQLNVTHSLLKKTQAMVIANKHAIGLKALQKIFTQLFRRGEINLKGEPLAGIQIMGMLETRNLDFKNVILLSANEGILPKVIESDSFIPFDIRHANKLPLPNEKNDIITYHFYRLIQRAENITILYNTDSDKIGSGEKSRFILQLENELKEVNKSINILNYITNIDIDVDNIPEKHTISIKKNEDVLNRLDEKAKTGFSASSLNVYRNCPLKFYFREILKLQEKHKIEPDIEFNIFGNAIHHVLEEVYKEFIGKKIYPERLKEKISEVDTILKKAFNEIYKGGNIKTGKNHLIYEIAKKYIKQFITFEIDDELTPVKQIIGLEERIEIILEVKNKELILKGFLDRIEKIEPGDHIRIIDYKTGKVEPKDLTMANWEMITDKSKDKLFQLLFYAYLYQKKHQIKYPPIIGIYSLRMLSNGLLEPKLPEGDNRFEAYMLELFNQIFDPSIHFNQTTDEKICEYCDYKDICNK